MKTIVIYPQSTALRKYVQYFLFIRNEDPSYDNKHVCYPNTNSCIGLHKGNRLIETRSGYYQMDKVSGYSSYLTGIYKTPITIHARGVFDEVCIDFEPLGLEQLTGVKLSNYPFLNNVVEDALHHQWKGIQETVFSYPDPYLRAKELESFILKRVVHKPRFDFIPFNRLPLIRIDMLKQEFGLSYISLYRLYKDATGLTPKEYLNLIRLRRSITALKNSSYLTSIAYDLSYSDQSHMIREFRKYTGLTPSKFLNKSWAVDNQVWWSTQ